MDEFNSANFVLNHADISNRSKLVSHKIQMRKIDLYALLHSLFFSFGI